jgi:hypothetical protein
MARGWESKSIEAQQAEASEKSSEPRRKLSPEEASRQREREGLRLSRQRILQELGATQHAHRRKGLEEALRELDKKLQSP